MAHPGDQRIKTLRRASISCSFMAGCVCKSRVKALSKFEGYDWRVGALVKMVIET